MEEPWNLLPGKESQKLLLDVLIPGIFAGINTESYNLRSEVQDEATAKKRTFMYDLEYVETRESTKDNCKIWEIMGYIKPGRNVKATKDMRSYGSKQEPVPLVKLPQVDERGMFNLQGELFYVISRQRLAANIPICTYKHESGKDRKLECEIRSANLYTCESRKLTIVRKKLAKDQYALCIIRSSRSGKGVKSNPVIKLLDYIMRGKPAEDSSKWLYKLAIGLGFSNKVANLLELEKAQASNTSIQDKYLLPSALDIAGNVTKLSYSWSIFGSDTEVGLSTETLEFVYIACKFLAIECGEMLPDDPDNYANKTVELPAVLLGLTLRKVMRNKLTRTSTQDSWKDMGDAVFYEICNSARENSWQVVDEKNSELRLSRSAAGLPEHSINNTLREVLTYRATTSSGITRGESYELRQLHPTQRGFVCMLMTHDDENAGYRQYLSRMGFVTTTIPSENDTRGFVARVKESRRMSISSFVDGIFELDEILTESKQDKIDYKAIKEVSRCLESGEKIPEDYNNLIGPVSKLSDLVNLSEFDKDVCSLKEIEDFAESTLVLWIHNHVACGRFPYKKLVEEFEKTTDATLSWNRNLNIVESRNYYGRFMTRLDDTNYDSREVVLRVPSLQSKLEPFSALVYEAPFMGRRPVSRTTLACKILGKNIGKPVLGYEDATYYKLLSPDDPEYGTITVAGKTEKVPEFPRDVKEYMNRYYFGRQSPLVRTAWGSNKDYGTHVISAEMTHKGYGVEDPLVINEESVKRGMFKIYEKVCIVWDATLIKRPILEWAILTNINEVVKEGSILMKASFEDEYNNKRETIIRHKNPYKALVSKINVVYTKDNRKPPVRVEFILTRRKYVHTGQKFASYHGQKMVVVKIAKPEELPTLIPISGEGLEEVKKIMEVRKYKPDIIIDPLSILARSTFSQILASTVALYAIAKGYDKVVEVPFSHVEAHKGDQKEVIDVDKIPRYLCKTIRPDGTESDIPTAIGCDYYILPPHIADSKAKGLGITSMNPVTGAPRKSGKEGPVRLGWQENIAAMHSNSKELIRDIYANDERLDEYPYCDTCRKSTEINKNKCIFCGEFVKSTIRLPKSMRALILSMEAMGCHMGFSH